MWLALPKSQYLGSPRVPRGTVYVIYMPPAASASVQEGVALFIYFYAPCKYMDIAKRPLSLQMVTGEAAGAIIGTFPLPFYHISEPIPSLGSYWLARLNAKKQQKNAYSD